MRKMDDKGDCNDRKKCRKGKKSHHKSRDLIVDPTANLASLPALVQARLLAHQARAPAPPQPARLLLHPAALLILTSAVPPPPTRIPHPNQRTLCNWSKRRYLKNINITTCHNLLINKRNSIVNWYNLWLWAYVELRIYQMNVCKYHYVHTHILYLFVFTLIFLRRITFYGLSTSDYHNYQFCDKRRHIRTGHYPQIPV